jgi:hypothetical protein
MNLEVEGVAHVMINRFITVEDGVKLTRDDEIVINEFRDVELTNIPNITVSQTSEYIERMLTACYISQCAHSSYFRCVSRENDMLKELNARIGDDLDKKSLDLATQKTITDNIDVEYRNFRNKTDRLKEHNAIIIVELKKKVNELEEQDHTPKHVGSYGKYKIPMMFSVVFGVIGAFVGSRL